jgi:hypothetical protein
MPFPLHATGELESSGVHVINTQLCSQFQPRFYMTTCVPEFTTTHQNQLRRLSSSKFETEIEYLITVWAAQMPLARHANGELRRS